MMKELISQLSKGYQVHVLNFSLHHILATLVESKTIVGGVLEPELVEAMTPLLIDEILGLGADKFEAEDA